MANRLVIDGMFMRSPGGEQLCRELAQSIDECAPDGSDAALIVPRGFTKFGGGRRLRVLALEDPAWGWLGRWRYYRRLLPSLVARENGSALYALSGILSRPMARQCGTVGMVNNMMPFTPEMIRLVPALSWARLRYALLRRQYTQTLRMAHAVVLSSQHALDRVRPHTGDIAHKTSVVLTGVPRDLRRIRPESLPHPYGGVPYFLYFSAIRPYKNHLRLVEAFHQATQIMADPPDLLIAGVPADPDCVRRIETRIGELGLRARVKNVGVLDRQDVPAWLHHAEVNFFPSTCETNSLVQAEILGLGGVMACSGIPPMNEVGGAAAEYFDPLDVGSIAATICLLARQPERRAALRRLALQRAAELSWDACGKVVWAAVEAAVRSHATKRKSIG